MSLVSLQADLEILDSLEKSDLERCLENSTGKAIAARNALVAIWWLWETV